ncbi:hypothetical protein PG997_001491 [Apiospora hydei]|uniref:Uncharacterized protein n=1 Tax=Apiospora hydei TaxID=1337664 RepID=A0ABR1XDN1_9PEZI
MSQDIRKTEAAQADGGALYGGLNQSVHGTQNKPIARPAAQSAGFYANRRTKSAVNFSAARGSVNAPLNGSANNSTSGRVSGRVNHHSRGHRHPTTTPNAIPYGSVNNSARSPVNGFANNHTNKPANKPANGHAKKAAKNHTKRPPIANPTTSMAIQTPTNRLK